MGGWLRARSCPPGNHLPPATVTSLLEHCPDGKVHATDRFEIELDEFGVPDPVKTMSKVLSVIDGPYIWPEFTNVHHFCWPRRAYQSEIERAYRQDPTLMGHIPVQSHNLLHELTLPSPMPHFEVMKGRVEERRRTTTLFELGRRAVRFARWSENLPLLTNDEADSAWLDRMTEYYKVRGDSDMQGFYHYLEQIPDGVYGIMPQREELFALPLDLAVQSLGKVAAIDSLDLRHSVQELTAA